MNKTKYIYAGLAALLLASASARAADFDARITNIDGSPLRDDSGKEATLTVKTVALNALLAPYADEKDLSADEKLRRGVLAQKISAGDTANLASEDIVLVKKLVNKYYASPLVIVQAFAALEKK